MMSLCQRSARIERDHCSAMTPPPRRTPKPAAHSQAAGRQPQLLLRQLSRPCTTSRWRFPTNRITALIGPSGCGKSTFLRTLNRINETMRDTRVEGEILLDGEDVLEHGRHRPAPPRRHGVPAAQSVPQVDLRQHRLRPARQRHWPGKRPLARRRGAEPARAALWDEVKDKLHESAYALSGGQQQRLCIARALAVDPEVLLLDEPCSALDPIATAKIEELLFSLKDQCTMVIVTHNMQQAARVADFTGFFLLGKLIEFDKTDVIFKNPAKKETEDYITGRFG